MKKKTKKEAKKTRRKVIKKVKKKSPQKKLHKQFRKKKSIWSKKELKEFENQLIEERKNILALLGDMQKNIFDKSSRDSSGDLSAYSFHMADIGTDSMDREREYMLASSEGVMLLEIDDALRKIYSGNFGVCERCNKPIEKTRLRAVLHARFCMKCQRETDEEKAKKTIEKR